MKKEKIKWYFNRLKSMDIKEVVWRVEQKTLEKKEKQIFNSSRPQVIDEIFNKELVRLKSNFKYENLGLNFHNNNYSISNKLWLFDNYIYDDVKNNWSYGFNTENNWPNIFSYDIDYKQNDEIGDARTNWELNRHFQFTILAKNYFITKDLEYYNELKVLFYDWNRRNTFLIGISWTSVMEIAIRAYSWIVTLSFLIAANIEDSEDIINDLKFGIINMIDYCNNHHSRYSSANNHLIIEMFSIGVAGVMFENKEWYEKAIDVLNKELFIQNYKDGVNKEHALHYQSFVMEAVLLLMLIFKRNNITYPSEWDKLMYNMSSFIKDNMDSRYQVSHLGDDDNGKILNLSGEYYNHFKYVLELATLILKEQFVDLKQVSENISWLFKDKEIKEKLNIYDNSKSKCYRIGGYTIMRNKPGYKNEIIIVIDHAELGFGSIAAHGHADALSFTMTVNGNKLFIDPGTYIYHIDLNSRNYFRQTKNHNTVCINDKDQSQMLGAFLWGNKANSKLIDYKINDEEEVLLASHDGYKPLQHERKFIYNRKDILIIEDLISGGECSFESTLVLDRDIKIIGIKENKIHLKSRENNFCIETNNVCKFMIEDIWISKMYSKKEKSKAIKLKGKCNKEIKIILKIKVL